MRLRLVTIMLALMAAAPPALAVERPQKCMLDREQDLQDPKREPYQIEVEMTIGFDNDTLTFTPKPEGTLSYFAMARSRDRIEFNRESITSDGGRLHYQGIFDKRTGNLELTSSESDPNGMRVAAIRQTGRCVEEDAKASPGG